MDRSIAERATDPSQYDQEEILWHQEGHGLSPVRRMFLERLSPHLGDLACQRVIDIGCGQGWLSHELAGRGAEVIGIDPSAKNIAAAKAQYPDTTFEQSDLHSYPGRREFDMAAAVMVFEHLRDAKSGFEKIHDLLRARGRLLLIASDFAKSVTPRHGYSVEVEPIAPGEAATRTDYGDRAGVIYDINRSTGALVRAAFPAGFELTMHAPIPAPQWLLKEHPRYSWHNGAPLFHLLEFEVREET